MNCYKCNSDDVKSLGFSDFGTNNIEIEEIECNQCHFRTRIPLQNKTKQLRDNMRSLEADGLTLNLDKVKTAIDKIATKNLEKTQDN